MNHYARSKNTDMVLLSLMILAIILGMVLLYSANHLDVALPLQQLKKGGTVAVAFFVILRYMNDRNIRELSIPMYVFSLCLLLLVLYTGFATKGAQRWLNLVFFRFEPSELVKITLPLALAAYIHQSGIPIRGYPLIAALFMIALPVLLVLKQPDLGTAMILCMIGAITLFIAGLSRRFILTTLLTILVLSPILWSQMHPYQQQRVMTLLSVNDDLRHHGYHIHQSKIAIGSGGIFGKGLGKGSQVQLGYIPEHKTDFIFTLMSEELGFFGGISWLLLILTVGFRSIYLGFQQAQLYNKLACISLGCSFMLNAWINMSMVSGLLPVVGIPLPFISYGATNFASTLINFGLILKLGHTDPRKQYLW